MIVSETEKCMHDIFHNHFWIIRKQFFSLKKKIT